MSTRRRRTPTDAILIAASLGLVLAAGSAAAAPPVVTRTAEDAALEARFRAAYPQLASASPSSARFAGVDMQRIGIAGLKVRARDDHPADDGGIVTSFADATDQVRAIVTVAVARDEAGARAFLEAALHGVSSELAFSPTLGDVAWADDGGRGTHLVVGARGNVAFLVDVLAVNAPAGTSPSAVPSAAKIAGTVSAALVAGRPDLPRASVVVPPTFDMKAGLPVGVQVSQGATYRLHADNAYVARGQAGPVAKPFKFGPVTVHATVTDALGRVVAVHATSTPRSP